VMSEAGFEPARCDESATPPITAIML